jgi:hypothetical protein
MSEAAGTDDVTRVSLPGTGHPEIAAALAGLSDLDRLPVGEHHERLAAVHELLDGALHPKDTPDSR